MKTIKIIPFITIYILYFILPKLKIDFHLKIILNVFLLIINLFIIYKIYKEKKNNPKFLLFILFVIISIAIHYYYTI